MVSVRAPKTVAAATGLCERFAQLESEIEEIEASRNKSIAATNAVADGIAQPLIEERDAIREKLAPWWAGNAAELTEGKRKSIELGGCQIGSVSGRASLAVDGDAKAKAEELHALRWGKDLTKVSVSLDRPAVLKALGGKHADKLKAMGLSKDAGENSFVLKRIDQSGTLAGAGK